MRGERIDLDRSRKGLAGALGNVMCVSELLPGFSGKRVLDLCCGYVLALSRYCTDAADLC
jgi:hypothetical protein